MVKDHRHQELDVVSEDRSLSPEASADQQAGDAPSVFQWIHVLAVIGLCTLLLLGVYHGASRRRLTKQTKEQKEKITPASHHTNLVAQGQHHDGLVDEGAAAAAAALTAHKANRARLDAAENAKVRTKAAKSVNSVSGITAAGCQKLCITKVGEEEHCLDRKTPDAKVFNYLEKCDREEQTTTKKDSDCKDVRWTFTVKANAEYKMKKGSSEDINTLMPKGDKNGTWTANGSKYKIVCSK